MWRLIWRGAASLITILSGLIIVIRAQPYDDIGVRRVLAETQECRVTCILGLQPGHTTLEAAITHLRTHNWVQDLRFQYDSVRQEGTMQWLWSGQQPPIINAQIPGAAQIRDGRISYVKLPTQAELWQFLLISGPPDAFHFLRVHSKAQHTLYHRVRYDDANLILLVDRVACPLSPTALYGSGIVLETFINADALIADEQDFHYSAAHLLGDVLDC